VNWFRLDLGDAVLAQPRVDAIARRAKEAFEAASRPAGWAVYLAHVSGELHCRAEVLFSPAAAALARELGAVPCAEPGERPSLLAGRADPDD